MLQFAHQRSWTRRVTNAAILCVLAALSGCTGCSNVGSQSSSSVSAQTYSLSSTISGLNSSGLVLMVYARHRSDADLIHMANELSTSGPMVMVNATAVSVAAGQTTQGLASSLRSGTSYSVTVQTQPTGETCTVAGGTGTIQSANVANVVVTCSNQAYSLEGSISGLNGSGLVLANGTDTLAVSSGATSFTMPTPVAYTSSYVVSVQTQPAGLACAVGNGTGTMPASAVTNVAITCTDQPFSLGGTISGLGNNAGLTLINGSDTLSGSRGQYQLHDAHSGCLRQPLLRCGADCPGGPHLHGEQRLRNDAGQQRSQHRHRLLGSVVHRGRHDQRAHQQRHGAGQWQRYARGELGCVELHDAHHRGLHQRLRRDGADAADGAYLLGEQRHGHDG